jgi:benzoyl-CoA-dihydrodiol lyase
VKKQAPGMITFDTDPTCYRHWRLVCEGPIATLSLDVDEDAGLAPGYKLKLNSYDLGVDIELHDALNRIRFEHPEVGAVVITSAKERIFCAGANIYMLGQSTHAAKVNFCKFTNETRNGMEDSSRDGLTFIAAVNGACAGGGYELALACDEIVMVDDRSSTISMPEVPLLGVLPGTGGLTRLIDKRKVRRDLADLFCTTAEGVRADRARQWNLVDHAAPPAQFAATVQARAMARAGNGRAASGGVRLPPLERAVEENGWRYTHVDAAFDRARRTATITVRAPNSPQSPDAGAAWWPLAMARELDDALLHLRANETELGTIILRTQGQLDAVLAIEVPLIERRDDWFVRETTGFLRRTFARLDVTSRSLFAVVDQGSCFAGVLAELLLAADRVYMLDAEEKAPRIALSAVNLGVFPMVNGLSRLTNRFCGSTEYVQRAQASIGEALDAKAAFGAGLVTLTPDELDWEDELRLAIEERASLSPDALSGLEANLRFAGPETMAARIFGRLSAWQNWIFGRPNAIGADGALKRFGTGSRPRFDWERV